MCRLALWAAARSLLKTSTLARFPGATNPHATWTLQFQQSMEQGKPSPGSIVVLEGFITDFLGKERLRMKISAMDFSLAGDKYLGRSYEEMDCQAFVEK